MYTVGEIVKHKTLGEGVIKEVHEREWIPGVMDTPILVIDFPEHPRMVSKDIESMTRTITRNYMSSEYEFTGSSLKPFLVTEGGTEDVIHS